MTEGSHCFPLCSRASGLPSPGSWGAPSEAPTPGTGLALPLPRVLLSPGLTKCRGRIHGDGANLRSPGPGFYGTVTAWRPGAGAGPLPRLTASGRPSSLSQLHLRRQWQRFLRGKSEKILVTTLPLELCPILVQTNKK